MYFVQFLYHFMEVFKEGVSCFWIFKEHEYLKSLIFLGTYSDGNLKLFLIKQYPVQRPFPFENQKMSERQSLYPSSCVQHTSEESIRVKSNIQLICKFNNRKQIIFVVLESIFKISKNLKDHSKYLLAVTNKLQILKDILTPYVWNKRKKYCYIIGLFPWGTLWFELQTLQVLYESWKMTAEIFRIIKHKLFHSIIC